MIFPRYREESKAGSSNRGLSHLCVCVVTCTTAKRDMFVKFEPCALTSRPTFPKPPKSLNLPPEVRAGRSTLYVCI